jgi:hydrogenase large subunit
LRIEAEVKDGKIVDAWSAGTMVRGIEIILKGRDPRDAWAFCERVCGVCTTVHALASVRSVEDALGIRIPPVAELIRNIMYCTQNVQDHVVHFYHLHALDWVDVVSALKADPKETSRIAQSLSSWPKSSPGYFSDLQKRLTGFVNSGQLGIFANGYWGHPAYKLPPEVNLIGVAHYLEALEWQKEIVKVHAIFGGKNPHPNYLVGGAPSCSRTPRISWSRSIIPTCWRSPPIISTGRRSGEAWRTTCATATCRPTASATSPATNSSAAPSSAGI